MKAPLSLSLCLAASAACSSTAPPSSGGTTASSAPSSATISSSQAAAPSASPSGAPSASQAAAAPSGPDTLSTSAGVLKITPVYHGTVLLELGGKVFLVDPWSKGPIDKLPKADVIFITDVHYDHFDKDALPKVKKDSTVIVAPPAVVADLPGAKPLKNGEKLSVEGIGVEAIPMYNKVRGPEAGKLFHDKGRGNGYVLSFGDKKVYLSGDTECTEEMKGLGGIDVAFVCMNLPYTMPPSEAAQCIQAFKPKVVYPYHYKGSDLKELTAALAGDKSVEVRLREWYP